MRKPMFPAATDRHTALMNWAFPMERVTVSLASVMGPPGCHDLGTTGSG
jgi:hypothetical protein